jgi:hypothetical protein
MSISAVMGVRCRRRQCLRKLLSVAAAGSLCRALPAGSNVPYDNFKAITHAKNWCGKLDNPCGKYFSGGNFSDCAHFQAHCLAAGGPKIKAPDPNFNPCPDGLAVRNTDLVAALRKLITDGATNISEIGLSDAIVGDIGFLDSPLRPYHAFMICKPVDLRITPPPPVQVWAHSTKRCCEAMDAQWRQWFSTSFRLTDG